MPKSRRALGEFPRSIATATNLTIEFRIVSGKVLLAIEGEVFPLTADDAAHVGAAFVEAADAARKEQG